MKSWYFDKGPESDVVISSRVRLARNFRNYPFPYKMDNEQCTRTLGEVKSAIFNGNSALAKDILFVDLNILNDVDRLSLVEKHLISPDMAENKRECGALISRDEKISIMVNEEDHLRIQCMFPGMQMDSAWKLCNNIDTLLEENIEFAFSKEYGYVTCCPTNIGTGLRASVMLHLPALMMTGYVKGILEACSKLGIAVRGIYGENSEASGNMFQISNQVTLGQTEEEIITSVTNIAFQIIEQERMLRNELYKQNSYRFEDKVFRALGIFTNARIISSEECLKLLSDVRLGVDMGIIKDIPIETINEIMLLTQPANLQKLAGKLLSPDERDISRAEVIRKKLTDKKV
ncbi:MAG: protein arginine kinase [Clostridia bacterium]|nr:protein arginine kinase [Clostridia bacterium]